MKSESQEIHFLLEEIDYDAQLFAIRSLLIREERAAQERETRIDEVDELAKRTRGAANYHAVEEWVDLVHGSCYQGAAHSMAAVGMLAPFIESVFRHAFPDDFRRIEKGKETRRLPLADRVGKLADQVEAREYMPDDLEATLAALFAYRNKMLHFGFEWPSKELEQFAKQLESSGWPRDWFSKATSDDRPWMFYMSPEFIDHCLGLVEEVVEGIEKFDARGPSNLLGNKKGPHT